MYVQKCFPKKHSWNSRTRYAFAARALCSRFTMRLSNQNDAYVRKLKTALKFKPKISITICFCIAYSTYICISDRAGPRAGPRSGPRPVFIWKAQSPTFEEWPKPGEAWARLLGKGLKFWVFHVVNLKPGVHGWAQARARFLEPDPSVKCIYILERDICITYILSWIIWGERTRFNQQRIKAGL